MKIEQITNEITEIEHASTEHLREIALRLGNELKEAKDEVERLKITGANIIQDAVMDKAELKQKPIEILREFSEAKREFYKLLFKELAELVKGKSFTGKYLDKKGNINGDEVNEFYRSIGYRLRRQGIDVFDKKCNEIFAKHGITLEGEWQK